MPPDSLTALSACTEGPFFFPGRAVLSAGRNGLQQQEKPKFEDLHSEPRICGITYALAFLTSQLKPSADASCQLPRPAAMTNHELHMFKLGLAALIDLDLLDLLLAIRIPDLVLELHRLWIGLFLEFLGLRLLRAQDWHKTSRIKIRNLCSHRLEAARK